MSNQSTRRIASEIMKAGQSRIRMTQTKELDEALTREDIRSLIRDGVVYKLQKKGTSKVNTKKIRSQKKIGRRVADGSRKGAYGAKNPSKKSWIKQIRALRKLLKEMKENGQIDTATYTKFYKRAKGGEFRSKKHLLMYLSGKDMLGEKPKAKKAAPKKAEKKDKK